MEPETRPSGSSESWPSARVGTDSVILTFVQVVTMLVTIAQTMILSRTLSTYEYGTYSQAQLVISLFTSLLSLGLPNAINYFFNKEADREKAKDYTATIIVVCIIADALGGVLLILCRDAVAAYYRNTAVAALMILIAFRPMIKNLISIYQPLYISTGMAKAIAIRNFVISVVQVLLVAIGSVILSSVTAIFALLLAMDIAQLFVFVAYFNKRKFKLRLHRYSTELVIPVLKYALPLFLASSVGTLSTNIDSLMIGGLMSTEDFALYSNMARELPFSFIVASFTTVVTPQIVKLLGQRDYDKFRKLWGDYLEFGYTVTWPLCVGAIVCAEPIIEFLYSAAYLSPIGVTVFRLYTLVGMYRFTYFGLVPQATGNSRVVLYYSVLGLVLNAVLVFPCYHLFGMPGPTVSTIVSMSIGSILYFKKSTELTGVKASEVMRPSRCLSVFILMFISSIIGNVVMRSLSSIGCNKILELVLTYGVIVGGVYLAKAKRIKELLQSMNSV